MATITPFDYHDDEDNHGNYQYIPLKEVVNGLQFDFSDDDHILKHTRRSRILHQVKNGIREYNKNVANNVLAIEMTVPENLVIAMPHNYTDYVRVSVVVEDAATESYRLKPLNINQNAHIAEGYLQDNDAAILFDQDGGILTADATNVYAKPYKKYEFYADPMGGYPELDTSKLAKYGEVAFDEKRGKISFSSDLYDQEIVLEYVGDGLEFDTYGEDEIKVHKQLIKLIKDYVYYECICGKKNVANNEIERARRRLRTTEHNSKLARSNFDLLEITRAMGTAAKNL